MAPPPRRLQWFFLCDGCGRPVQPMEQMTEEENGICRTGRMRQQFVTVYNNNTPYELVTVPRRFLSAALIAAGRCNRNEHSYLSTSIVIYLLSLKVRSILSASFLFPDALAIHKSLMLNACDFKVPRRIHPIALMKGALLRAERFSLQRARTDTDTNIPQLTIKEKISFFPLILSLAPRHGYDPCGDFERRDGVRTSRHWQRGLLLPPRQRG